MSSEKVVNKIREIVANSSGAILGFTLLCCNQFDTSDKFQLRIRHGCHSESFNQTIAVPSPAEFTKASIPGPDTNMLQIPFVKTNYKLQIMIINQGNNRTRHENDDHELNVSTRTDKESSRSRTNITLHATNHSLGGSVQRMCEEPASQCGLGFRIQVHSSARISI
jgi:hypothetical protein